MLTMTCIKKLENAALEFECSSNCWNSPHLRRSVCPSVTQSGNSNTMYSMAASQKVYNTKGPLFKNGRIF